MSVMLMCIQTHKNTFEVKASACGPHISECGKNYRFQASVVERLPGKYEALGSISSYHQNKNNIK
jgi:hypothetical protein